MTQVVCLPVAGAPGVIGTPTGITVNGTTHASDALRDSSDSTWVDLTNVAQFKLSVAAPTAPSPSADFKVAWVRWKMRVRKVDNGTGVDQNPALKCVLDGSCGRALPDRPWDRIGMQTTTRISWSTIITVRVRGDFSANGLPVATAPSNMTLLITRDEEDDDWMPRIYKAFVEVAYVPRPVVSVVKPAGTITEASHPEVRWENTRLNLTLGGPQHRYHVKVFDDANYLAGGFTPTAGTADLNSTSTIGSTVRYEMDDPLIDDTYRTYVRVAQRINGELWWSQWGWKGFTQTASRPAVPTFSLTAESTSARMRINMTRVAGAATTTHFQVQRSTTGTGNWEGVRTSLGRGLLPITGTTGVAHDYEGRNGQTIYYRVRAANVSGPLPQPGEPFGNWFVFSAWATTQSSSWTDTRWWFIHPFDSTLNVTREVRSQPGRTRGARAEVFQPLGSETAIVVSDTYEPWSGELIVRNNNDNERDAWDALIADGLPIIIQPPVGTGAVYDWPKRMWVHVSEHSRERMVDAASFPITWDRIAWQEVARPTAPQPDNPLIVEPAETTTTAATDESP